MFTRKPTFPLYFSNGKTNCRVISETKYTKVWLDKELKLCESVTQLQHNTYEDIFTKAAGWKQISEAQYQKAFERLSTPASHKGEIAIKFAFEIAGRAFYTFVNAMDIPTGRHKEAGFILKEYEEMASRETSLKAWKAVLTILNNPKEIKITDIGLIASNEIARREMLWDFDLYKKIASVYYFDETENLSEYNLEYNKEKMRFWDSNGGDAFFLNLPINNLVPPAATSSEGSADFLKQNRDALKIFEVILEQLSKNT